MASSLVPNCTFKLDNGSPLKWHKRRRQLEVGIEYVGYLLFSTHVEAQPMRGFSQRSRLSNSICHVLMLSVPLCIAFLGGTWMRTRRSFSCSWGTPESELTSTATGTVILPLSLLRCSISSGRANAVLGSSGAVSEDAHRAAVLHERRNQF